MLTEETVDAAEQRRGSVCQPTGSGCVYVCLWCGRRYNVCYVRTVYVEILFTPSPQRALWAEIYDHHPGQCSHEIAAGMDVDVCSTRGLFIICYRFIVLFARLNNKGY